MRRAVILCAGLLAACGTSFEPASFVEGGRVLAVKAEPPEVAPGQATTLTALAVDGSGAPIQLSWDACTEPALTGGGPINPACLAAGAEPYLVPLGVGLSITANVPQVVPSDFGPPDASGGLYLPIRARTRFAGGLVDVIYELRLAQGAPPNHNPRLLGLFVVPATGPPLPLDEASPREVHAGERITLRAQFGEGSAETYPIPVPGQSGTATELLRASWFATGGSLSEAVTGEQKPDTVWRADKHLPAAGVVIDLYVVGRDDRGGTDFLHRSLILKP